MTYFFSSNINEDSNNQKKVSLKGRIKEELKESFQENIKDDFKEDIKEEFLDEFEKSVLDANLSDEIKSNLMKMVNRSRSSESKKIEENQRKAEELVRREEKRISRLKILERIIKEVDIEKVHGKEEEIIDSIRGGRFKAGGVCPHCGYKKIWKYGKYCGNQRYKYKSEECKNLPYG